MANIAETWDAIAKLRLADPVASAQAALELDTAVRVLGYSAVAVDGPADTSENILATVPVVALGANEGLIYEFQWTVTNNANAKTARVRLNGVGGTVYSQRDLASGSGTSGRGRIHNRGASNSQIGSMHIGMTHGGVAWTWGHVTSSIDMSGTVNVVFTAQKASAGDLMRLETYSVIKVMAP